MTLITGSIPNMVNGVSQQPATLRLASQCDLQLNGLSSVVDGLSKRPPSIFKSKFLPTKLSNCHLHTINRDSAERYSVVIAGSDLRVFDKLTGTEKTVNFPDGKAYLTSANPKGDFSATTVADYTFIVNKTVKVEKAPTVVAPRFSEALVWVKQGAYSTTYNIGLNGFVATYTTQDSAIPTNADSLKTEWIAGVLKDQLIAHFGSQFFLQQRGSTIYIASTTMGVDMSIDVSDSQGDSAIKLVKGRVQRFSDLPAKGFPAFAVSVRSSETSDALNEYWVAYEETPGNTNEGIWKEGMKPNEPYQLRNETMPHILVREADGTFTFKMGPWENRHVGDQEIVPWPSIVDRTINDVFFFRNRLGLLADENVVLSEAGEFFNLFRTSAIQTLDSDPIDIAGTHTKVSIFHHAVPFNQTLLLFSDQAQFAFGKADLLSPKTVSLTLTTQFETDLGAKPVGAGNNVYFATRNGEWTGFREYFVDPATTQNDATEVTAHVPKYIPSGVRKITASTLHNMLAAITTGDPRSIYVYRYFWGGQDKLLSSWSKWTFGPSDEVLDCEMIDSDLVLVVARPEGTFFETLSLASDAADAPFDFQVHLDHRFDQAVAAPVYNAGTNTTTITMPYLPQAGEVFQIVAATDTVVAQTYQGGSVVPFTRTGSTVTVPGKLTRYFMGSVYRFQYRYSTPILRAASDSGGKEPVLSGRVQVRNFVVNYDRTGFFQAVVTPKYGSGPYTYTFTGRVLGSAQNVLGSMPLESSNFRFPIMSKNDQVTIDLVSDNFLPCRFLSTEWEAISVVRAQRT